MKFSKKKEKEEKETKSCKLFRNQKSLKIKWDIEINFFFIMVLKGWTRSGFKTFDPKGAKEI